MRYSALALKLDLETRLPTFIRKNEVNAQILNEKQTDESYQIFIPSNTINMIWIM